MEKQFRKLKRMGFKLNSRNKIEYSELEFKNPDHFRQDKIYAWGCPIDVGVAQRMIQNYWDSLSNADGDKDIAVTFGKEALLSILSQEGCSGIRFYFAKRLAEDYVKNTEIGEIEDGLTLVAIGSNTKNLDIGVPRNTNGSRKYDYIVRPLKPGVAIQEIKSDEIVEEGDIREMVPPLKLKYFLNEDKNLIAKDYSAIAEIIKEYFKNKK